MASRQKVEQAGAPSILAPFFMLVGGMLLGIAFLALEIPIAAYAGFTVALLGLVWTIFGNFRSGRRRRR